VVAAEAWRPGQGVLVVHFKLLNFAVLTALTVTSGAWFSAPANASEPSMLRAQILVSGNSVAAYKPVVVTLKLHNPSHAPQYVLSWLTPESDVAENLFSVTKNGVDLPYNGAVYKRAPATAADYITIAAGATRSWKVDLAKSFDFRTTGEYAVVYQVASQTLSSPEGRGSHQLRSSAARLSVEGRPSPKTTATPATVSGSTSFNKCSSAQQSALLTARTNASNYTSAALGNVTQYSTSLRYGRWFGQDDGSREATVKTHFTRINTAMSSATVKFDCSSKKKVYAFVNPSRPYIINLAALFWNAPAIGTDSKAGTLVHEMSHFTVVAGTGDYAYGQTAAEQLAGSNPNQAVANADNHEYFAENNPALGNPSLSLSQGPATSNGFGYNVSVSGFNARNQVTITCRDTNRPSGFATSSWYLDTTGSVYLPSLCGSGTGDHWVTSSTGLESNHVYWSTAPPPPTQSVTLSWGARAPSSYCGGDTSCTYLTISWSGFSTGNHTITPYFDGQGDWCAGASCSSSLVRSGSSGSLTGYWTVGYCAQSHTVSATVDGVWSNALNTTSHGC
jgi:peptidyl-Lys metalloendopeptidase